ncbi:MAG TPA: hypothetical protein VKN36_10955 [Eudoraea sp.]|nr:hypothetical protein [Eudoraea sp.]
MKKVILVLWIAIGAMSCNAQEHKEADKQTAETPEGTWSVNKEFDESGNMIRYDSIYSWSSSDDLAGMKTRDRDSLLQSFQSKFYRHFSAADPRRFEHLFEPDSLFHEKFFNEDFFDSDFGRDFMDIDRVRKRMEAMEKVFFDRYQNDFPSPDPENPDHP